MSPIPPLNSKPSHPWKDKILPGLVMIAIGVGVLLGPEVLLEMIASTGANQETLVVERLSLSNYDSMPWALIFGGGVTLKGIASLFSGLFSLA